MTFDIQNENESGAGDNESPSTLQACTTLVPTVPNNNTGGWSGEGADDNDGQQSSLAPPTDYPAPAAARGQRPFFWDVDELAVNTYPEFARRLAATGDLYRRPAYGSGLLLGSDCANIPPIEITKGSQLAAISTDRVPLVVIKDGKPKGSRIPAADLTNMLSSELFLREFRPVDMVVTQPMYLGQFQLTRPGYNDAGRGHRVLYVGEPPPIASSTDTTSRFLDVMAFASNADRTNAVAAALTVLLRNFWPGNKPIVLVTSTKSHAGKETIIVFAAGCTPMVSISYEGADWALQKAFVQSIKHDGSIGLVDIENVRPDAGREVASAFIERFLTDPEPLLYSPGTGAPVRRPNHFVLGLTTTYGRLSTDLHNRGLPVHMDCIGNVADRGSPIGNPKLDYLPANRHQIEAELRGMVEKWKSEGRPIDTNVRHPFGPWAETVGGILMANGFTDFLGNYEERRTTDDPVWQALSLLGAYRLDEWLPAHKWVQIVAHLGLANSLIPKSDRETPESRCRGLGIVMTAHQAETFVVETDDEILTIRLEKNRKRFDSEEPSTRYRFVVMERNPLPKDLPH